MTVQAVQEAGWRLQQPPGDGSGACAEGLQDKLQQLSHRWSQVLAETEHRQLALEHNLSQVKPGGGSPGQAFPGLEDQQPGGASSAGGSLMAFAQGLGGGPLKSGSSFCSPRPGHSAHFLPGAPEGAGGFSGGGWVDAVVGPCGVAALLFQDHLGPPRSHQGQTGRTLGEFLPRCLLHARDTAAFLDG